MKGDKIKKRKDIKMKRRFSNNLKEMRKLNEMTQSEVSEMIGVTLNTYQNYENGFTLPRVDTAINLADTLICEVEDIWGLELELKAQDYRKRMSYKQELIAQGQSRINDEILDLWVEYREDGEGSRLTKKEAETKERFFLFPGDTPLEFVKETYGISDPEEIKEEIENLEYNEDVHILQNGIIMEMY